MNTLFRKALAVALFAGVAVPVGYSSAQAGTSETGCHNIVPGSEAEFRAVIESATMSQAGLLDDPTVQKEFYPDAGLVHAEMLLEGPSCASATYSVVVRSTHVEARGSRQVFRELSRHGDGTSSTLVFDGFIDVFTGYTDAVDDHCVEVLLRVQDSAGRTIDVAPDAGQAAVELCKDLGGAQAYAG